MSGALELRIGDVEKSPEGITVGIEALAIPIAQLGSPGFGGGAQVGGGGAVSVTNKGRVSYTPPGAPGPGPTSSPLPGAPPSPPGASPWG